MDSQRVPEQGRRKPCAHGGASRPAHGSLERLDAELESFSASLSRLVAGLEDRFVPLGRQLRDLVADLGHLGSVCESTLDGMRSDLEDGDLGKLHTVAARNVDVLRAHVDAGTNKIEPLRNISDDVRELARLSREVDRMATFLWVCRCSFAVESSRTAESERVFASFVADMHSLVDNLRSIARAASGDSTALLARLNDACGTVQRDVVELQRLTVKTGKEFDQAAAEVGELLDRTRALVGEVERHRNGIVRHTGEVVYYLQFGDLVRQKCEHVLGALEDARRLRASGADDPASRGSLGALLRTESVQLDLIQREIAEAQRQLDRAYAALGRELDDLVRCSRSLEQGDGLSGTQRSAWSRLGRRLKELERIQRRAVALGDEAGHSVESAARAAAALYDQFVGMRQVGRRLHLLALNSLVLTARQGEQGSTVAALGRQLHAVHEGCDAMVAQLLAVLERMQGRVRDATAEPIELSGLASADVEELERVAERGKSSVQQILLLGRSAEQKLGHARSELECLSILSNEIRERRRGLDALLPSLPVVVGARGDLEARLAARYTMESEREAHRHAAEGGVSGTHLRVPSAVEAKASPNLAIAAGDDFGDNVELF